MVWNSMSHVGLEADYFVTPEMLTNLASTWHYGWRWKGSEIDVGCTCVFAPCGLIATRSNNCYYHHDKREGAAKQLHKSTDCPSLGETK